MTGTELNTLLNTLVDKTIDIDTALELLNQSKDRIESERPWEFLKVSGNTTPSTTTVGGTYTTSYDLPSDFAYELKVYIGDNEVLPISEDEAIRYKGIDRRYYINFADLHIFFTGTVAESETITIIYIKTTSDLTTSTSPSWPTRFHKILAYEAAQIYLSGLDTDDLSARMFPFIKKQADELLEGMRHWNTERALKSIDQSAAFRGVEEHYQDDVI